MPALGRGARTGRKRNWNRRQLLDLDGHSLLATQVMSGVRKMFGVDVPLRSLFEEPIVANPAQCIEQEKQRRAAAAMPPLVRVSCE